MLDASLEIQKILAVDDNTYTLRIVQHTLEHAGFQVLTAVSGKEALNLINRHGMPHLAILTFGSRQTTRLHLGKTVLRCCD